MGMQLDLTTNVMLFCIGMIHMFGSLVIDALFVRS
jgi:hypothetical protein